MQLPILLDPEVLQLLKQGRIDGFGYSYEQLKDVEDVYGRYINNGLCECVQEALQKDPETGETYIETEEVFWSDDPQFTEDEIDKMAATREFIKLYILSQSNLDPSSISEERG